MIYIYSDIKSNRLTYVLNFCFKEKGVDYEIISDVEKWDTIQGTKFNYSAKELDCDYAIDPSGLLFEEGIDKYLRLENIQNKIGLRGSKDGLSVIFFLLSRYEEYFEHEKDKHGRFPSAISQQTELGILKDPLADQITKKLWHKLGLDYNVIQDQFELVPSFDIDIAWAYKHRPFWRTIGAFKYGKLVERLSVLLRRKKDPYDTYSIINNIAAQLNRIICFAPVSDYGPLDKNIHWKNIHYQSLIRGLNTSGGMGLHPGYASFMNAEKITAEKERLEEILGHEMQKSRFHFLRFDVTKSYDLMIELGFKKDYSMGYADEAGFRAGTSFPYFYFDLNTNKVKDYLIFPFVYLDNAYKDYLNYTPAQAVEEIQEMMQKVKEVGGVFMCIWHNHSINDKGEWRSWQEVLNETVECSKS